MAFDTLYMYIHACTHTREDYIKQKGERRNEKAERRLAEQRLKDTQSQGDDSPATPLQFTSSSAAINRSEAAPRSPLTVIYQTKC